jgi:hypothetical protein
LRARFERRQISVTVIASPVGLRLLTDTWTFLAGPLIDSTLSVARWYVLAVMAVAACALEFGCTTLQVSSTAVRGACAGWRQTGYLDGMGQGGGVGLWLATHTGGARQALGALWTVLLYALIVGAWRPATVPPATVDAQVAT